jgi:methanogenic corrinoid protein MtbC1
MPIEQLFETLITGDRPAARSIVDDCLRETGAEAVISDLLWPAYERVADLHRKDRLTTVAHHMATRLLRVLADQAALHLEARPSRGRSIFAVCGPTDADELAAQMAVDLLEGDGYDIVFSGGGIANDEILQQVQERRPEVLLIFASAPSDLPNIRALIDTINEIGACRDTQVVVGGGVFNRAEGLAEEIGADLWAESPADLLIEMESSPKRKASPGQRTVGRNKRRSAA